MRTRRIRAVATALLASALLALLWSAGPADGQKTKAKTPEWTDPNDPNLPIDYKLQGEYTGTLGDQKLGCQVIALGKGHFQAVVLPGGLPGAGWDGKYKALMDGKLDGDKVTFEPTKGKRSYKSKKLEEFSATSKFPPPGQKTCTANLTGDTLSLKTEEGATVELKKTVRTSPTMGKKPPDGAIVLFDGSNTDEWVGGRLDKKTGWLSTDRKDIKSKRKFNDYSVHLEFLTPFLPEARDQGRGNSGFYQVHHYEVQILDSFGLDGKNNECGGLYSNHDSRVNMCLPPLTWQTYDIDFTNTVADESGKKVVKRPRITVRHNGVLIHEDAEYKAPTGSNRPDPEGTPGPFLLQGHGNIVQFRNIWVVEKK